MKTYKVLIREIESLQEKSINDYIPEELKKYAIDNKKWKEGEVVIVRNRIGGGDKSKFNIHKVTPTEIHVYDHNEKKIIKFNKNTKDGKGENKHLKVRKSLTD